MNDNAKTCIETGCCKPALWAVKLLVPPKGDEGPEGARADMFASAVTCDDHFDVVANGIKSDPTIRRNVAAMLAANGFAEPNFDAAEMVKVSVLDDEYLSFLKMAQQYPKGGHVMRAEPLVLSSPPPEMLAEYVKDLRAMADDLEAGRIQQVYAVAMKNHNEQHAIATYGAYVSGSLPLVLRALARDMKCDCGRPGCNITAMGNGITALLDGRMLAPLMGASNGQRPN